MTSALKRYSEAILVVQLSVHIWMNCELSGLVYFTFTAVYRWVIWRHHITLSYKSQGEIPQCYMPVSVQPKVEDERQTGRELMPCRWSLQASLLSMFAVETDRLIRLLHLQDFSLLSHHISIKS